MACPRSPTSGPARHVTGRIHGAGSLPAAAALALGCCEISGCTRASDEQRFPPVADELRIVETFPAADAGDVAPDVQIDFCFSGLIDPRALDDFDATISSGNVTFDADLSVQLVAWREPGGGVPDPAADAPWCPGSVLSLAPRSELPGGVLYRVRLRPSAVGWGGERLETDGEGWTVEEDGEVHFFLEFRVGDGGSDAGTGTGTGTEPEASSSIASLFEAGGVWDPASEVCGCHVSGGSMARELAVERLDLSTPAAAFDDLLGSSRLRDTGFPMVTPRVPSESFLIHKLLRDGDGAVHGVLGDPMPPQAPLPHHRLLEIVGWIEDGAEE